ncbi:MAG TPA: N-acetylmuramoyl-L-alanine amidase [Solirubrobacteraceae bacterium]|nr:N-acetylmuramoyl-L-alanine amidase [Solirubrobacteraceae bacterium]
MTADDSNALTRRAVLRGAAVAGAVSLVGPTGAMGRAKLTPGPVFSQWVGRLAGESAQIAAQARFSLVGVEWASPARPTIELRTRMPSGPWSPWATASVLGHGPDRPSSESEAVQFGEAIWTGPADYVQLRSPSRVDGLRLHFVAARPVPLSAHAAQALPLAQPVLDAGPGQPPIIARSAWAHGHAPPSRVPLYGTVKLAFVHHSVTPNGYSAGDVPAILTSIFDYHRYVRGYFDIAYNFAVDAFGRIWEARAGGVDLPIVGAHAGGYNTESSGMVVLGTYADAAPSTAALGALERLLAWKLSLHGVPVLGRVTVEVAPYDAFYTPFRPGAHVSLPRVAGHRDGDLTDCPGNALYARLPSIRPRVARLVGSPAQATIAAPTAPVSPGAAVTVTGRLIDLASGGPITGAPIEIQQIAPHAEQTIATVATDADGTWSFTFNPAVNALVRALHGEAPAAVSDVVAISVVPTLTLTLVANQPLTVAGTVSPPGPRVTIDLYKFVHGRRRLMVSKRVPTARGQFHTRLKTKGPGRYIVIAQTAASARYVAGLSGPLPVIVS